MANIARYLGFVEEASYGESPAPEAVMHVDVASIGIDVPADPEMIYGGGLSRGPYIHRPGFYSPSGDISYAFDVRSIGFLLKWALGGYSFLDGGGSNNTHTIYGSADNILDSFCARVGKDVFEHIFSGCVINTLNISVQGEYCQVTAGIIAQKDSKGTLKTIDELLLPSEYPLAFHEVTAKIATVDESAIIKGFDLNISNNLTAESGRTIGTRYPRLLRAGERTITLSKTLMFDDTDQLENYWGDSDGPSDDGPTDLALEITFDAGDDGSIVISLPRFIYTNVEQKPSGRDALEQATAGRAFLAETLTGVEADDTDISIEIENGEDDMTLAS